MKTDPKLMIGGFSVASILAVFAAIDLDDLERWFALARNYPAVTLGIFVVIGFSIIGALLYHDRNECRKEITQLRDLFFPVLKANVRESDLPVSEDEFKRGDFDKEELKEVVERRSTDKRKHVPVAERRS